MGFGFARWSLWLGVLFGVAWWAQIGVEPGRIMGVASGLTPANLSRTLERGTAADWTGIQVWFQAEVSAQRVSMRHRELSRSRRLARVLFESVEAAPNPVRARQTASQRKSSAGSPRIGVESLNSRPDDSRALRGGESRRDVVAFSARQVQKVLEQLQAQPLRPQGHAVHANLGIRATKQNWLTVVYEHQLVESSWATAMLSDKLVLDRVARSLLGDEWAKSSALKTLGLVEFLVKHQLVDAQGRWRNSQSLQQVGERLDEALANEFPNGFSVRPAVGVSKNETAVGMFANSDEFIQEILKASTDLYRPDHISKPRRSLALDQVASGEMYVLQERPRPERWNSQNPKPRWREVRVHTYEGRVVEGAAIRRWTKVDEPNVIEVEAAEGFVRELLSKLPSRVLARQAWSVDVWVNSDSLAAGQVQEKDSGAARVDRSESTQQVQVGRPEVRLFEIITNRGRKLAWSQYLEQPRVLAAYTRHFENYASIEFDGAGAWLFRNNLGNYFGYWSHRIDRSPRGLDRLISYLPPLP